MRNTCWIGMAASPARRDKDRGGVVVSHKGWPGARRPMGGAAAPLCVPGRRPPAARYARRVKGRFARGWQRAAASGKGVARAGTRACGQTRPPLAANDPLGLAPSQGRRGRKGGSSGQARRAPQARPVDPGRAGLPRRGRRNRNRRRSYVKRSVVTQVRGFEGCEGRHDNSLGLDDPSA